ncbi:DUF2877 domain-containing protein [Alkaliphilus crotonatoxidans]
MSKGESANFGGVKSNFLALLLNNHCAGKVHSKFRQGINVQLANTLIYIGCSKAPLSVFGLNVPEGKLKVLLDSVTIDDVVVNKGNRLIFYSVYGLINVDYHNAEEVDLKLPKIFLSTSEIKNTKLFQYLEGIEWKETIGITLDEKTLSYLELLLNTDKADFDMNTRVIKYFAGRGKGLTPSGDDILIGFTLALRLFDQFDIWDKALDLTVTVSRTTMISVAYTKALLRGYASQSLISLAKLINQGETDGIESTIYAIQSMGHTSGSDTLFGFLLGLKFLTKLPLKMSK